MEDKTNIEKIIDQWLIDQKEYYEKLDNFDSVRLDGIFDLKDLAEQIYQTGIKNEYKIAGEIKDFSPKDIAIQIMKAIEVADISDFNGKNVFEAGAYDDIFNAIVYGIEESNKLAYQAGIQDAIDLSDKIEADTPTTEFEEWRAFKRFRNTLRDLSSKE